MAFREPAEALAEELAESEARPEIYVCSQPALIRETEAVALAGDAPHDRMLSEQFSPTDPDGAPN